MCWQVVGPLYKREAKYFSSSVSALFLGKLTRVWLVGKGLVKRTELGVVRDLLKCLQDS